MFSCAKRSSRTGSACRTAGGGMNGTRSPSRCCRKFPFPRKQAGAGCILQTGRNSGNRSIIRRSTRADAARPQLRSTARPPACILSRAGAVPPSRVDQMGEMRQGSFPVPLRRAVAADASRHGSDRFWGPRPRSHADMKRGEQTTHLRRSPASRSWRKRASSRVGESAAKKASGSG